MSKRFGTISGLDAGQGKTSENTLRVSNGCSSEGGSVFSDTSLDPLLLVLGDEGSYNYDVPLIYNREGEPVSFRYSAFQFLLKVEHDVGAKLQARIMGTVVPFEHGSIPADDWFENITELLTGDEYIEQDGNGEETALVIVDLPIPLTAIRVQITALDGSDPACEYTAYCYYRVME